MASTVRISFSLIDPNTIVDFNYGTINVPYTVNGTSHNLTLTVTPFNLGNGFVVLAEFTGFTFNDVQASNYAAAFARDYGTISGVNLTVSASGSIVTISSPLGAFGTPVYSGDFMSINTDVQNGTDPVEITFTATRQNTGNCLDIDYLVEATGGTGPYRLEANGSDIFPGWDGTEQTQVLKRGVTYNLVAVDANGETSATLTVTVPRSLVATEFTDTQIASAATADITIIESNPVTNTGPIEYSLEAETATNGASYQTSSSFPGILEGTYRLFIRDRYGCEVSRLLIVSGNGQTGGDSQESVDFFSITPFNSVGFAECVDFTAYIKRNARNTISPVANVELPYNEIYDFVNTDTFPVQWKSSYPFHVVTLWQCDGTRTTLAFTRIQQNLGALERVDCRIFPATGGIGVYFDGGNQYDPGTTTATGASPYDGSLPPWVNIGQQVNLVGQGQKEILEIRFDETLQENYFLVAGSIAAQTTDIIEVQYNVQDYDLFQFEFATSLFTDKAHIVIEAGQSFNQIQRTFVSEAMRIITDTRRHVFLEWQGSKNIDDAVYTNSDFRGIMRVIAEVDEYPKSESETIEGDDRSYSLLQDARVGVKVNFWRVTQKKWETINKASTVSKAGTFKINNEELIKTSMEYVKLGQTNLKTITMEFDKQSQSNAIRQDEVVFNISTGVEGSGGDGTSQYDGRIRLTIGGSMLTVGGNFITID